MQGVSFFSIIFIILSVTTWGLWGFFGKVAMEKGMPAFSIFLAEILVGFSIGLAVLLP